MRSWLRLRCSNHREGRGFFGWMDRRVEEKVAAESIKEPEGVTRYL
jgi:hypothetical protein